MNKESLIELLEERPFVPLRVHMSKGRTHEITHPENAIVGDDLAAVLVVREGRELIRHFALAHVNEVEPITTTSSCSMRRQDHLFAKSSVVVAAGATERKDKPAETAGF